MERALHTHTEEFYETTDFPVEVAALNQELLAREHTHNTVRPHQALGYKTPDQFYPDWLNPHLMRKEVFPICPDPVHLLVSYPLL